MPAVVTFDASSLRIIPVDTGGDIELDMVEVYSEWKEWAKTGDNIKHPQAFRYIGGDPVTDTQNAGSTFFILNGWRFRPVERSHKLTLVGNIFSDPAGSSVFVPTLGSYTVNTETRVSNLVDSSVARLDLTQLLPAVFIDVSNGVAGTDLGVGTPTNPVNNIADAYTIATRDALREYRFRGSLTLDRAYTQWTFRGLGAESASTVDLNSQNVTDSDFAHLTMQGVSSGPINASSCRLLVVSGLDGVFRDCGFAGSFSVASGSDVVFSRCYSEIPGNTAPVCGLAATAQVSFRGYSGGLELDNAAAGTTVSVDMSPGHVTINNTCTAGTILVRGMSEITDNSAGSTVISTGMVKAEDLALTRKMVANRLEVDLTAQQLVLYEDDGVTVAWRADLETDGGEDVATQLGVQTKRLPV